MSMIKTCSSCKVEKECTAAEFLPRLLKSGKISFRNPCRQCYRNRSNAFKNADPDRHKSYQLLSLYGITLKQKIEMSSLQNDRCKICFSASLLVVDHCHKTNKIRGLLCKKCNQALGLLQENLTIAENAVAYLKENEK